MLSRYYNIWHIVSLITSAPFPSSPRLPTTLLSCCLYFSSPLLHLNRSLAFTQKSAKDQLVKIQPARNRRIRGVSVCRRHVCGRRYRVLILILNMIVSAPLSLICRALCNSPSHGIRDRLISLCGGGFRLCQFYAKKKKHLT